MLPPSTAAILRGDPRRLPRSVGCEALAGPVDGVIGEQVKRLVAFAESGKPE